MGRSSITGAVAGGWFLRNILKALLQMDAEDPSSSQKRRKVGPGVTLVESGDHVVLSFAVYCRHCFYCSIGRPVLCDNTLNTHCPWGYAVMTGVGAVFNTVKVELGEQRRGHWMRRGRA
jgi:hypothetical protein